MPSLPSPYKRSRNQNAIVKMYIVCSLVVFQLRKLVYASTAYSTVLQLMIIYVLIQPDIICLKK